MEDDWDTIWVAYYQDNLSRWVFIPFFLFTERSEDFLPLDCLALPDVFYFYGQKDDFEMEK